MAAAFAFFILQVFLIQTAVSQCVNRVVPGCQSNLVEAVMPNQVLFREQVGPVVPPYIPAIGPNPFIPAFESLAYGPGIAQDSSVANSLANALQLLVVSSLLSTALPGPCDYPVYPGIPNYPAIPSYPPLSYPVETLVSPTGPYSYIY